MTPVGHSLTGAALAAAFLPHGLSARGKWSLLGAYVVVANLPDLPLPGWGHDAYHVSHSVFVNAAVMVAVVGLLFRAPGAASSGLALITAGGVLAWFSHLLLDSFYGHGLGVALLWPLSDARLALPIAWFETWRGMPPPLNGHTFRVAATEFLFYFPLVVLFLEGRRLYARRGSHAASD